MAIKNRELPLKEAQVFRNVLKNYELKQYKKGLKLVESILKTFPDHGESLAMKGLFLSNLEKKKEGYEYVKKGVLKDLTSHICWHVYGLLHRTDKNYEEAAKCYANALKFNKNDMNILRDYAILQTQLRQYDALVTTRTRLMENKPEIPAYWLGVAIAYQLVNQPQNGVKVLEALADADIAATNTPYEKSELLMYHNMLLEEAGDIQVAYDHLQQIESDVTDKKAWKEKNALFLVKLGKKQEGEAAYRVLVSENPNNVDYVKAILALYEKDQVYKILEGLYLEYPRSRIIEQLILEYAEGEKFKVRVDASLQHGLRKGIPSLFTSMRKHYSDVEKKKTIERLLEGYRVNLEKDGRFSESGAKEPPTALLWVLYYLAKQHNLYKENEKALDYINQAIAHTPTVVELYMTKGRILKHAGQVEAASVVMNEAREIDLQDRFINSKCGKYLLRANKIEEAEGVMGLFTRKDVEPIQDLKDMQCQWVMIEEGHAYLRLKDYGKALERFRSVEKFYSVYFEDQFDFHGYCLRKLTLRDYVKTLRWEDRLKVHPFYRKAVKGAIETYLALHDSRTIIVDESSMTEAEKKKARNKARKAALKAQQDQESKKDNKKEDKKDTDETQNPLEDALTLLKPLGSQPEIQHLAFEVYLRQQRYLLAIKSLLNIDKSSTEFKEKLERLKAAVKSHQDLDSNIKQVIDIQLSQIK